MSVVSGCSGNQTAESRWTDSEIKYYINHNASDQSVRAIQTAFDSWANETHFSFEYAGRNRAGLKKDGKNTVSFLTQWPDDIPFGQTAWSRCWYDRKGRIIECDIIFNQELARFTSLETNRADSYYIEGVAVHEIGHMIGLGHSAAASSVMKPESTTEESWFKGEIDDETIAMYRELYNTD